MPTTAGVNYFPQPGGSGSGSPFGYYGNNQMQQQSVPSAGNPYGNLPNFNASTTPQNLPGQATQQNLSTAPDLSSLTNLVNQLNLQGQTAANAGRIPGDPALEQQSSQNIASLLGGNIPQDVVTQIQQQAAERGVATGSPGSDNSNSALLRSLGLTSLDLQGLGQQQLSAADARNPVAPIFDPSKMFLTPAQLGELNNQGAFLGLDWYKALTGQGGLGGGSRGGNQNFGGAGIPSSGDTGTSTGSSNWWDSITGGTPGPVNPPPTVPVTGFGPLGPGIFTGDLPDTGGLQFDPTQSSLPPDLYGDGTFSAYG